MSINTVRANECHSIDECIALIPNAEGKVWGKGNVDEQVRSKLSSFGKKALLPLAKLTSEQDPNRRAVADSLIASMDDLDESDFDIVLNVIQNNIKFDGDHGWSVGALGYVGGERASKYLVAELKRAQSSSNQIGTAFYRLGIEGIPYLIQGLRCFKSCNERDFGGFDSVFRSYQRWGKITSEEASKELFKIVSNDQIALEARTTAMSVIGYITEDPQIAREILHYSNKHNEFSDSALFSLQNMKSPFAAELLIEKLNDGTKTPSTPDSNFTIFRDLSEIGLAANSVGDKLIPYLNSTVWENRSYAAVTLGNIGYYQAIPELLKLLSNKEDWQQVYAALNALNLFIDKSTVAQIEKVANSHWYKPLREYANKVAIAISSGKSYKSGTERNYLDLLNYNQISEEDHICDEEDYSILPESSENKQYQSDEQSLSAFRYKNPMCSDSRYEEDYREFCFSDESFITPSVAVKFSESWITGDDRGEWGGELIAFSNNKPTKTLLNENIEDIYVLGDYAYVITGLAHMIFNNGLIYRLENTESGYLIQPLYRLPGAPMSSWKISNNSILINTMSGSVIFNPEQGLKMSTCAAQ